MVFPSANDLCGIGGYIDHVQTFTRTNRIPWDCRVVKTMSDSAEMHAIDPGAHVHIFVGFQDGARNYLCGVAAGVGFASIAFEWVDEFRDETDMCPACLRVYADR